MEEANLIVNIVIAVIAAAAAVTTIILYNKNKRDRCRQAATVLLSEMRQVVNLLGIIKNDFNKNNFLVERRYLLGKSSWDEYKYIILTKISFEQWDSLNRFFEAVKLYDKAVSISDGFFKNSSDQVWINLYKHYLKVLEEETSLKTENGVFKIDDNTSCDLIKFRDFYINNAVKYTFYNPMLPINMAKEALEDIDGNIITSSVGERIVKLASR